MSLRTLLDVTDADVFGNDDILIEASRMIVIEIK